MKRRRANKKFEPTLCEETLEKLQKFECGQPNLSQHSTDDERPLQDKLIPICDSLPEKLTRKDKLLHAQN